MEGNLAGPLRNRRWVGAAEGEGGCPLQVEVEGSWLAGVAGVGKVLVNSWQPKEVVEGGGQDLEAVGAGSRPMAEVEVGHFQSPEMTEYTITIQNVQEEDVFYIVPRNQS